MPPYLYYILCTLCFLLPKKANTQPLGIDIKDNLKVAHVPFELHNNLIVIKVQFQKRIPLKFILDTGSQYTVLTERLYADMLAVNYSRIVRLYGSDKEQRLEAKVATNVSMDIGSIQFRKHSMLVLEEDYLNLETVLGTPVHGILGSDLFKRFVVRIDYQRKLLSFFERPESRLNLNAYDSLEIELLQGKPYMRTKVELNADSTCVLKLLIDSGASMAFMLHPDEEDEMLPDYVRSGEIAFGLGGTLKGYLGKIQKLHFGNDEYADLITSIQESPYHIDSLKIEERDGLIGGLLLQKYTVVFDYYLKKMYLKKNKNFKKAFKIDRSGLQIIAAGKELNNFFIDQVRQNSPAEKVGLLAGDEIIRLNAKPAYSLSLKNIVEIFQGKIGKRIRIIVKRKGEKKKYEFYLKDLL